MSTCMPAVDCLTAHNVLWYGLRTSRPAIPNTTAACAPFSTLSILLLCTDTSAMYVDQGRPRDTHSKYALFQTQGYLLTQCQTRAQTLGLKAVLEESVASAIAAVDLKLLLVVL